MDFFCWDCNVLLLTSKAVWLFLMGLFRRNWFANPASWLDSSPKHVWERNQPPKSLKTLSWHSINHSYIQLMSIDDFTLKALLFFSRRSLHHRSYNNGCDHNSEHYCTLNYCGANDYRRGDNHCCVHHHSRGDYNKRSNNLAEHYSRYGSTSLLGTQHSVFFLFLTLLWTKLRSEFAQWTPKAHWVKTICQRSSRFKTTPSSTKWLPFNELGSPLRAK